MSIFNKHLIVLATMLMSGEVNSTVIDFNQIGHTGWQEGAVEYVTDESTVSINAFSFDDDAVLHNAYFNITGSQPGREGLGICSHDDKEIKQWLGGGTTVRCPLNSAAGGTPFRSFINDKDALLFDFSETQTGRATFWSGTNFRTGSVSRFKYWYGSGVTPDFLSLSETYLTDIYGSGTVFGFSGKTGGIGFHHADTNYDYDWMLMSATGFRDLFYLSGINSHKANSPSVTVPEPSMLLLLLGAFFLSIIFYYKKSSSVKPSPSTNHENNMDTHAKKNI